MKRKDNGKYRQISNTVTVINAKGLRPKKLIGVSITSMSINIAFIDPEKGSNKIIQVKATAIIGAT